MAVIFVLVQLFLCNSMPKENPMKRSPAAPAIQTPAAKMPTPRRIRPVPAVSRAIAILRLLGRSPTPLGVKSIAEELELVPSTCLHILRVLVHEDLLRVDPATKRYTMGVGMLPLAHSVLERLNFPGLVQPVLDQLAAEWNMSAIGVEVRGLDHMTVLALSKSQAPFRLQVDVGSRFPALVSATGRLAAAYSELPWRDIEKKFREVRWGKTPDLAAWRKDLDLVRQKGYSMDKGNYIPGVTIIAAPILDAQGHLTHSLVVVGVGSLSEGGRSTAIAREIKEHADQLSKSLLSS